MDQATFDIAGDEVDKYPVYDRINAPYPTAPTFIDEFSGDETLSAVSPPLFDVVSWQARPGSLIGTKWSGTTLNQEPLSEDHENDLQTTFVMGHPIPIVLRRPRGRIGPGERAFLIHKPQLSGPILGGAMTYYAMSLVLVLGTTQRPAADTYYPVVSDNARYRRCLDDKAQAQQQVFILPGRRFERTTHPETGEPLEDNASFTAFELASRYDVTIVSGPDSRFYTGDIENPTEVSQMLLVKDEVPVHQGENYPALGSKLFKDPIDTSVIQAVVLSHMIQNPGEENWEQIASDDPKTWAWRSPSLWPVLAKIVQDHVAFGPNVPDNLTRMSWLYSSGGWLMLVKWAKDQNEAGESIWTPSTEYYARVQIVDANRILQPNGVSVALYSTDRARNDPEARLLSSGYGILPNSSFSRLTPTPHDTEKSLIEWSKSADIWTVEPSLKDKQARPRFDLAVYGPSGEFLPK